jgi:uncharacterized membrane protein
MRNRAALGLSAFLTGAGITHVVNPGFYDPMVPRVLPGSARLWTYLSGAAELAVAATVAYPRTRKTGGALAAGLFIAVFPGNLQMAWDWRERSTPERAAAYGRLPLQIPLVVWGLRVRAGSVALDGRHARQEPEQCVS